MLLLVLSLLAVAVGPGLAHLSKNRPRVLEALDGFVIATIAGIVVLHVVPHALAELGARTVVPLALGLALPSWLERPRRTSSRAIGIETLLVIGLSLHALIDGIALNTHEGHTHGGHDVDGGEVLAIAVSLHRIPEGLAVWWIVAPKRGPRAGVLALVIVGAASCAGFLLSEPLAERIPTTVFLAFEVLVAGSLLHVVAHHELTSHHGDTHEHDSHHHHVHGGGALASGIGAIFGGLFLFTITREHPITHRVAQELGFGTTFETLALASAPVVMLSLGASAVLHTFGATLYSRIESGLGATARGWLAGWLMPICSCGALAFYAAQARRDGAPRRDLLTLLVSAPEMELASVLLSAVLIHPWFALVRPLALSIAGVVAGVVLGGAPPASPLTRTDARPSRREGMRFALGETVEHTGPWLLFGLIAAAFVEPFVEPAAMAGVPLPLLIGGATVLGAFVPLCASGATPLLAVLVHKGIDPGVLLAFLIMAAAGNVRVLRVLAHAHSRAFAVRYGALLVFLACAVGTVVVVWHAHVETPLHRASTAHGNVVAWASVVCLVLLFAAAILRRGPRWLLLQLVALSRG